MSTNSNPTVPGTPIALRRGSSGGTGAVAEFNKGHLLGDYLLEELLASGGCGTVYSARHRLLGRRVAIKILHSELATSSEMFERFVREARVVNQVRHPNIVDVSGFGEVSPGRPYLVMELLPGFSLHSVIERRGRLTIAESLAFLEPICAALSTAHQAGVVHRDLKANNVMVVEEGETPRVKLLDFGIAKLVRPSPGDPKLTAVGQRLGTPTAMAPEQIRGEEIDARTDLYALGILLFHMLTGRFPFESKDPVELERQHLEAKPPRPGEFAPVPPLIEAVVMRCLEKNPAGRFTSAAAFLEALRAAQSETASLEQPVRRREAIALFVETRVGRGFENDDRLLEELGTLLDETEQRLVAAGYCLFLATGSAILGVRLLADDPLAAQEERRSGAALARSLEGLARQAAAHVHLSVLVHCDLADARERDGGVEIVGGPVVELESWQAQEQSGVQLTSAPSEGP